MFDNGLKNTALAYGPASSNAVGLDADTPQRYAQGCALLTGLGIETWQVRRPPCGDDHDGGGLIVVRTHERAQGTNLPGLDVKTAGYSLIPFSRHPGGVDYYTESAGPEHIFTLPSLNALSPWVELTPWEPLPSLTEVESRLVDRCSIPRLASRILAGDAEVIERYATRSEAEYACLCSLINAGLSFEECRRLFISRPVAGKFRDKWTRNSVEAVAWLEHSYRAAAKFVINNPGPARTLARALRQWADSRPWPGRTGATDHAVYVAHLSLVEKCGRQPYGASCRELAEIAGVGRQTAANANTRLRQAGLLRLVQKATLTLSNKFQLVDVTHECANLDTLYSFTVGECPTMHIGHDTFRWAGLNKTGAQLWAVLLKHSEMTERELQEATGRDRTTITRKLKTMFGLGMVEPLGNGYWQVLPDLDLDAIAEELGTAGLGEKQKQDHQHQRRLHRRAVGYHKLRCDTESTEHRL